MSACLFPPFLRVLLRRVSGPNHNGRRCVTRWNGMMNNKALEESSQLWEKLRIAPQNVCPSNSYILLFAIRITRICLEMNVKPFVKKREFTFVCL